MRARPRGRGRIRNRRAVPDAPSSGQSELEADAELQRPRVERPLTWLNREPFERLKFTIGAQFRTLKRSSMPVSRWPAKLERLVEAEVQQRHRVRPVVAEVRASRRSALPAFGRLDRDAAGVLPAALDLEVRADADLVRKLVPARQVELPGGRLLAVAHRRIDVLVVGRC